MSMGLGLWLDIFYEVLAKHRIKHTVRRTIMAHMPYEYPFDLSKYIKNWKPIMKEVMAQYLQLQFTDGAERYEVWLKEFEKGDIKEVKGIGVY